MKPEKEKKIMTNYTGCLQTSVADPGCLPRTHTGSKNSNKRHWWKNMCCHTFFRGI